jgi:dolichol-phosphate mannosyltransferase
MFSVILPMKNEPCPGDALGRVHEALEGFPDCYEVLVVTGDREKTPFKCPPFPRTRSIVTYGDALERSIFNGFSQARGETLAVLDADGSHPAALLPQMWELLREYELVVGSRFVPGAEFHHSLGRGFVTDLTKFMAHQAGSKLRDPMSGFFALRRSVLDRCRFRPLTWKIALEVELRAHPSVKEIPIRFVERTSGKSNTSLKIGLKLLWELYTEGWD